MIKPILYNIFDNFPYPTAKLVVDVLNLCMEFLSLFHFSAILFLVSKNFLIHRNLKVVSYNVWICGIIKSGASIYNDFQRIFFPNFMLPFSLEVTFYAVKKITDSGMINLPSAIVIERMYSIINAKNYENWFSRKFIVIVCGSVWISSIWIMVHLFYLQFLFSIQYTYAFSNAVLFIVYMLYFISYFMTAKKSVIGLTLSERYQRAQNEVAYSAMLKFAITAALTTLVSILFVINSLFLLPYYFEEITLRDKFIFQSLNFKLIVGCLHLVLPCNFVSVHPSLKKQYCEFFGFARFKHSKVVTVGEPASITQIHSVTGQNLQVPNETNFYFNSLTDQWDAKLVKTKRTLVKIG